MNEYEVAVERNETNVTRKQAPTTRCRCLEKKGQQNTRVYAFYFAIKFGLNSLFIAMLKKCWYRNDTKRKEEGLTHLFIHARNNSFQSEFFFDSHFTECMRAHSEQSRIQTIERRRRIEQIQHQKKTKLS